MEIIVEGHTDTDKINSSSIPRDNWELSVLRATEVIKYMMANSNLKPEFVSASGRSEYYPVDPKDKSKNRRIEIILQPKLDELYQLIEGEQFVFNSVSKESNYETHSMIAITQSGIKQKKPSIDGFFCFKSYLFGFLIEWNHK